MNLKGKKILLITPILFHYHLTLKDKLEKMGASVFFFPDQKKDAFTALKRKAFPKISNFYYDKVFNKIKNQHIDFFLLINGKGISRDFIKKLRKRNPTSIFITYQWDSITRNNLDRKTNYLYFLDLFDRSFSFDLEDSKNIENLKYLPNFHTINPIKKSSKKKKNIDVLMVATYSDERYKFIQENRAKFKDLDIVFFDHLYLPFHHYLLFKFIKRKKINRSLIQFKTINKTVMQDLYVRSKSVLDIPYKNQTGFTMRIMEGIANKCHIYTTNQLIANEPFYSKNNISIFNQSNFFDRYIASKNIIFNKDESNIEYLYIENWIAKIFDPKV